jgi:23S rRNA (guanosine2251-2'-O)-methyltransferase
MKNNTHHYDVIIGKNVVMEIITNFPDRVFDIFTLDHKKHEKRGNDIITIATSKNIPVNYVSKKKMDDMACSESHQSFVARIKKRKTYALKEWLQKINDEDKVLLVMLDNIQDPQNIGAIMRSMECFGANGVVLSKNRGGSITPVVSKVSSGATEYIDIITVSNLATTVLQLQKDGFDVIVADVGKGAISLSEISFVDKTLLIMGAEAKGVQPLIKKYADKKVSIDMKGRIDSLNVAQATSVFLYQWSNS